MKIYFNEYSRYEKLLKNYYIQIMYHKIKCVFGYAVEKIEFGRIEFDRIDFG
jgi:hypothetical protein